MVFKILDNFNHETFSKSIEELNKISNSLKNTENTQKIASTILEDLKPLKDLKQKGSDSAIFKLLNKKDSTLSFLQKKTLYKSIRKIFDEIFEHKNDNVELKECYQILEPTMSQFNKMDFTEKPSKLRLPTSMIDSKLLGFIHGDTFIEKSGLEGGDLYENILFLFFYLESNPQVLKNANDFIKMFKNVQKAPRIDIATSNPHKKFQRSVQEYTTKVSKKIKTLAKGKKMIMQGGWENAGGGHAILVNIR